MYSQLWDGSILFSHPFFISLEFLCGERLEGDFWCVTLFFPATHPQRVLGASCQLLWGECRGNDMAFLQIKYVCTSPYIGRGWVEARDGLKSMFVGLGSQSHPRRSVPKISAGDILNTIWFYWMSFISMCYI